MNFTVEEENLICMFDISGRGALMNDIRAAMPDFDEPAQDGLAEMREIAESALKKLDAMTDAEFAALNFCPAYYNDESEV